MEKTIIKYDDVKMYCEQMHVAANKIKNVAEKLKSKAELISLNMWQSEAAEAYQKQAKEILDNLESTYKEIEYAILYIAKCSDGYEAIDSLTMKSIQDNLGLSNIDFNSSTIFNN